MKKIILIFILLLLIGCGKIQPGNRIDLVQNAYPDSQIFTRDEIRFVIKNQNGEIFWVEVDMPIFADSKIIISRRIFQ